MENSEDFKINDRVELSEGQENDGFLIELRDVDEKMKKKGKKSKKISKKEKKKELYEEIEENFEIHHGICDKEVYQNIEEIEVYETLEALIDRNVIEVSNVNDEHKQDWILCGCENVKCCLF